MADLLYNGLDPLYGVVEATTSESLFLEVGEDVYEPWVVAAGQVLKAGTVVGLVTATQKLKLSDNAASDGSQNPYAVLTHPVDTTSGDKSMSVLVRSNRRLNANALVLGPGHTMANIRQKLSLRGISIQSPGHSG